MEPGGLAVADGDRTGFVQQQRVDVACGFDGAARFGNYVGLQRTVHTGDADGREQSPDRCRDQADEQRDQCGDRQVRSHVVRERFERGADDYEYQRESGQQDRQCDFVRGFLARSAFDQCDHFVEEALAGLCGDFGADTVRQHLRTARHRTFVAARFADHRCAFARDRAFVDRSQSFDDLAVGGDRVSGDAFENIVFLQSGTADDLYGTSRNQFGGSLLAGFAQRVGLRFAARFCDRLGEVCEEECCEQHKEDDEVVAERTLRRVAR